MTTLNNAIIISVALIISATILGTNVARTSPHSTSDKTISVQGEGKSNLVPDIYTFSITANEVGKTTKEVNKVLAQKIAEAKKVLQNNKIEAKDIQSQNVDISENRVYTNNTSKVEWYRGSHTLSIKIRNIANAWKIIDEITDIDGLLVNGGQYDHLDDSSTLSQARTLAFENAKAKAKELAKLSGMKLGEVVSINEEINNNLPYPPVYYTRQEMAADGAGSEINPGEQELSLYLNVSFELN